MHLLVVGGTQFVGRHLVAAALSGGHQVSLLHRGQGPDPLFPAAQHLHADRNGGLHVLAGRRFDACVDVSAYRPEQVRSLAAALGDRAGAHLLISTVSVYDHPAAGFDESSPLLAPGEGYGPAKVACEQQVRDSYGQVTIVRPTYVIGPYDHTGRFTWWVRRLAVGGRVPAPGPAQAPMQTIDARDLAEFCLRLLTTGTTGTFHAASPAPPYSLGELLTATAEALAPAGTELVWRSADQLAAAGVPAGAFPLAAGPAATSLAADPGAALAAGLRPRPIADSARDILAETDTPIPPEVGVSVEQQAALLAVG